MKKLLLVLFTLFTLNSFSQTYFPFPDSVGVWRQSSFSASMGQLTGSTHYSFFIHGDTIINSNTYSKLYLSYYPNSTNPDSAIYFAALRENQKKLYAHLDSNSLTDYDYYVHFYYRLCSSLWSSFPNYNTDLLLYDFNVSTFIIWCLFSFLIECSENSLGAVVILPLVRIGYLTSWMQYIVGQAWASCMVHGALAFHRKCSEKRLGHQMYMHGGVCGGI